MQNLYWKMSKGKTVNLTDTPFSSEQAFEEYLHRNQEILGDVFIFKRQIHSGSKQGIPDMLGVDRDGKICLIELKNGTVTEDVLPQVLQYAIWAETNPDSIKALWLEARERPEDKEINWESLEIRILVVGPAFRFNVLNMSNKIGYEVALFEVRRFVAGREEFVLVEKLEEQQLGKSGVTKGLETYDREFYEKKHGKQATKEFMRAASEIESIAKRRSWKVQKKFNKQYLAFKYGNNNPFGVNWIGARAWNIHIKVPKPQAESFKAENWEMQSYNPGWKEAVFKRKNPKAKVSALEKLLADAYEKIQGEA